MEQSAEEQDDAAVRAVRQSTNDHELDRHQCIKSVAVEGVHSDRHVRSRPGTHLIRLDVPQIIAQSVLLSNEQDARASVLPIHNIWLGSPNAAHPAQCQTASNHTTKSNSTILLSLGV